MMIKPSTYISKFLWKDDKRRPIGHNEHVLLETVTLNVLYTA